MEKYQGGFGLVPIFSMAMTQEPIYWRYLPYIRPIYKGLNFREYHHNSYGQKYGTNIPPF